MARFNHLSSGRMKDTVPKTKDPLVARAVRRVAWLARSTPPGLALFKTLHRKEQRFSCPVCGYKGPFVTLQAIYGERKHAECPACGALERHRLLSLVLDTLEQRGNIARTSILHFAPERFFRGRFEVMFKSYTAIDPVMRRVDMRADLRALPFADDSQDLVFASYILQYIDDDLRALREIRRVLRPNGIAILPVTIVGEKTIEYPEPNIHESGGHIRAPGLDYYDRFEGVFSKVDLYKSEDFPEHNQLYVYEDRTGWPTKEMPLRQPMKGHRHPEIIPVCWR